MASGIVVRSVFLHPYRLYIIGTSERSKTSLQQITTLLDTVTKEKLLQYFDEFSSSAATIWHFSMSYVMNVYVTI